MGQVDFDERAALNHLRELPTMYTERRGEISDRKLQVREFGRPATVRTARCMPALRSVPGQGGSRAGALGSTGNGGQEPFSVESRWFTGNCEITTYDLDELLGTKLRALYQRCKGRDLFDMATALSSGNGDPKRMVAAIDRYTAEGGHRVTRAEFERNLAERLDDKRFVSDISPLLEAGEVWNAVEAAELVTDKRCPLLT